MIPFRNAIRLLFIFGFCLLGKAQAQFIANGGQWPEVVQFRTDLPGGRLYIEENRLTFDLYDQETTNAVFAAHGGNVPAIPVPENLMCHAYQVIFEGASAQSRPFGKKDLQTRYSFYLGNNPDQWGSDLSAFGEIYQRDIYPGIDLKIYRKSTLKYDFIVKPNADPGQIRMSYMGVKPILTRTGELSIKTTVGEVIESKPFAYQMINGAVKVVPCAYRLSRNEVGFDLGEYNPNYELIIDPELIFSTYSGSFSDNFGYTATYDAQGHLYAGSSSFGIGYPITTGAYQAAWAGGTGAGNLAGTDIALSKFSLDGTQLIYSTYLGGSSDELPHSLITDEDGSLYLLGTTGSGNFPITPGAFQTTFQGGTQTLLGGVGVEYENGSDMMVCRLGPSGTALLASTYMGGSANDGINTDENLSFNYADEVRGEIELDGDGNILVGSNTFSENFPTVPGCFQTTKNANQEGVLFKLNNTATTLLASTFFGGSGADAIYSINTVEDGTIMVAGGTSSNDLSMPADAYQNAYGGGRSDGYIATFNSALTSLENATYFGSSTYDQIYFVERDEENFPHIYGQTNAPDNTFIFNAEYNVPNSGMLLSKLNRNLTGLEWSTVFGNGNTTPNLSPTAFSVDICNRIYLSGWGGLVGGGEQGLTTGLAVTPDALKSTTNGGDFYFMVLSNDASELIFASFFGGNQSSEHVDGGTSRFDRAGKIYQAVCAGCGSNDDFPIEPANALSPINNSFNCNLGVAKIDFDLPLVIADFETANVCLPAAAFFTNTSETQEGSNPFIQWNFGDGTASSLQNPSHIYENPGIYEVSLIVTDPLACNISDTLTQSIQIFPALTLNLPDTIQSCDLLALPVTADSEGTADLFTWATDAAFGDILLSGSTDSILTYGGEPGFIFINISSELCEFTDSLFVIPAPEFALSLPDTILCSIQALSLSVLISNGHATGSLIWSPDEVIISGQGTDEISIDASAPVNISVSGVSNFGCQLVATVQIDVFPIALSASNDTLICDEEPVLLFADSEGLATSFLWSSTSDFTDQLNITGDSALTVFPGVLTYYYIQVENNGCFLIDSVAVGELSAGTTVSGDQFICEGDTANLFVSNDFPGNDITHTWFPEEDIISGQGTSFAQSIATETTTFTVISTSGNGCIVENNTTIFTSPLGRDTAAAQAIPQNITLGGSSAISVVPVNPIYTYQWTPSTWLDNAFSPNTTSTPEETITYYITISDFDTRGVCAKSDSITIFVFEAICGRPNIFVPNAFTPNSDGDNDVVFVRGGGVTDIEFTIFDRWGNQIFKTIDQRQGWDGTYKDNLAEPAVYVYYLEVKCGDGQTFSDKGNITLIR